MKKYQQGDVLIIVIPEGSHAEWEKVTNGKYTDTHTKENGDGGNVVLAFGEVTGHSHQFKPEDMVANEGQKILSYHTKHTQYGEKGTKRDIIDDEAKAIQVLADEGMTLYHEEHAPITVPPGKYQIKIVQEFNHMTQSQARVWD